jgi:hypothetical protein
VAAIENADELAGYCQSLERGAKGAGRHIVIPSTREALTCWGYMQAMQDLSVLVGTGLVFPHSLLLRLESSAMRCGGMGLARASQLIFQGTVLRSSTCELMGVSGRQLQTGRWFQI